MEGKVEIMKKRCAAFFLFVILILGTVVPVCAEAVQEYPETESGSITSDQELYSEQGYTEEDSDLVFTEKESDPELTEVFVKMGIDELSMSPTSILRTRKIIRDMD